MKFESWEEMYDTIVDGTDLYSKSNELYVFVYNDANALCFYNLSNEEAMEISIKANEKGEYWAAFLGWGGEIMDNTDYDGYSDDENERKLYLNPSVNFCKDYFNIDDWVDTRDFMG